MTKWDSDKQERVYYWERDDTVPKIHLEIKNEDQEPGLLDVTTEHMKSSDDDKDFFVRDLVTDEPILIHSLMFPYPAIDVPFALNAVPVIGTGRQNSSFTPVGTTGMRFVEDESRVERVMARVLNHFQKPNWTLCVKILVYWRNNVFISKIAEVPHTFNSV
jgi:hypothetical protein